MFKSSFKIATVWGIPIKVHISLVILMAALAMTLGISSGAAGVLTILVLIAMLFASIALHELGHSFVAIRKGCRVREITLMFMGGAAQMEEIPRKPIDEIQMAIAGPAVSVVVGLLCILASKILALSYNHIALVLGSLFYEVGILNFILAGFNLIPAFPMDGGRVFRAILSMKHDRIKATYIASRLGKIVAIIFGLVAISQKMYMLLALAFFIYSLADKEYKMVRLQEQSRWFGFGPPEDDLEPEWHRTAPPDDNTVEISPPPYEKGPGSRTHIKTNNRDNPFTNLFG